MRRVWSALAVLIVVATAGCTGSSSSDRAKDDRSKRPVEVEAFMNVRATPTQIAAVRRALRRSQAVRTFKLVSQEDAYRELGRLFVDQPELVATVAPASLPASFHIQLVDAAKRGRFVHSLERLAGVDEVKTGAVFVSNCENAKKRIAPELREQLSRICSSAFSAR